MSYILCYSYLIKCAWNSQLWNMNTQIISTFHHLCVELNSWNNRYRFCFIIGKRTTCVIVGIKTLPLSPSRYNGNVVASSTEKRFKINLAKCYRRVTAITPRVSRSQSDSNSCSRVPRRKSSGARPNPESFKRYHDSTSCVRSASVRNRRGQLRRLTASSNDIARARR